MMIKTQAVPLLEEGSPTKLFYRINEVAQVTGLKPYVLRYWESEFPQLHPEKDSSGGRRYRIKDIRTILAIRKLLYEDRFTIKGARQRLKGELKNGKKQGSNGHSASPAKEAKVPEPAEAETNGKSAASVHESLCLLRDDIVNVLKLLEA